MSSSPSDWGEASLAFDEIKARVVEIDITAANEAQTRFDIIDSIIKEVLGWPHHQIRVEEPVREGHGYIDYSLLCGDYSIVVEAKRIGATFPNPTKRKKLKMSGAVLSSGEIGKAISQAREYGSSQKADVVVVTNGLCWCFFSLRDADDDSFASLLFPFEKEDDAERLFDTFSLCCVESGSLESISNRPPVIENRLVTTVKMAAGRIDRNSVADHLVPALDAALYADALLADRESLNRCYISTDARVRYDKQLGLHLAEAKPVTINPISRIKRAKTRGPLQEIAETQVSRFAPPVTLIIGPVGVGKTTYLRHFEVVSGRKVLSEKKSHWITVDFEEMGKQQQPRQFIYDILNDYLLEDHPDNPTDWDAVIKPAYAENFRALARGPFAPLSRNDPDEYQRKMQEIVEKDFAQREPYVDRIYQYISSHQLCVVVLDNVDLYEDEELEKSVFAEGLALSKRLRCHVIVSIRDTTYAKHSSTSTFDAYELRKLWLDPPPFPAVLSRRLSYAKKVLEAQSGHLIIGKFRFEISDLSSFFDIVQQSLLDGQSGYFIEAMTDFDIRRGLELVTSFLTSGHIEADRAVLNYAKANRYVFPFHEVFKGTMLGQWRHFQENKTTKCINLFDARLGQQRLQLLRLAVLNELAFRAREENSGIPVKELSRIFSECGASENHTIQCLEFLRKKGLIRSGDATEIRPDSVCLITRSGGYYIKYLCMRLIYVEECMYDTAVGDERTWNAILQLTEAIEADPDRSDRIRTRKERVEFFLDYLMHLEREFLSPVQSVAHLFSLENIRDNVLRDADVAIKSAKRLYGRH